MRSFHTLTAAVLIGAATLTARGQAEAPAPDNQPVPPPPRVIVKFGSGSGPIQPPGDNFSDYNKPAGPAVKKTFLGVFTSPAQPSLQKQLQLKAGVGLVVDSVEVGGPAEQAGVKEFDVLHKLDDQVLINSEQLRVLLQNFKPGQEIQLTVIREGKPLDLTAKLQEHDEAPTRFSLSSPRGMAPGQVRIDGLPGTPGRSRTFVVTPQGGQVRTNTPDGQRFASGSTITIENDQRRMTVTTSNGRKHLKVEDKAGKVLFDGPIDTPENLDKVPADLRKAYEETFVDNLPTSLPAAIGGGSSPPVDKAKPEKAEPEKP